MLALTDYELEIVSQAAVALPQPRSLDNFAHNFVAQFLVTQYLRGGAPPNFDWRGSVGC